LTNPFVLLTKKAPALDSFKEKIFFVTGRLSRTAASGRSDYAMLLQAAEFNWLSVSCERPGACRIFRSIALRS